MIAENLQNVKKIIEQKCSEVNRNPDEIKVVAVSKNFGIKEIEEAYNSGLEDLGENKAQELDKKFEILGDKLTWHFIGHLQRNKVRFVVQAAKYIHSVDSLMLATEINKRAAKIDKVQKILIQVNTSLEESKHGLEEESELHDLVKYCFEYPNVAPVGLMTMAPFTEDEKIIRKSFSYLRKLRDELKENDFNLPELSMGMTNDYEIAIEEGATMLRIGSAIFGERDYSKNWKDL